MLCEKGHPARRPPSLATSIATALTATFPATLAITVSPPAVRLSLVRRGAWGLEDRRRRLPLAYRGREATTPVSVGTY